MSKHTLLVGFFIILLSVLSGLAVQEIATQADDKLVANKMPPAPTGWTLHVLEGVSIGKANSTDARKQLDIILNREPSPEEITEFTVYLAQKDAVRRWLEINEMQIPKNAVIPFSSCSHDKVKNFPTTADKNRYSQLSFAGWYYTPDKHTPGDANGDGVLNLEDIIPFEMAKHAPEDYSKNYSNVKNVNLILDMNADGVFNEHDSIYEMLERQDPEAFANHKIERGTQIRR